MISISAAVGILLWFLLACAIFGLCWLLVNLCSKLTEDAGLQAKIRNIGHLVLCILAVLVLLGLALSFLTGSPLFTR